MSVRLFQLQRFGVQFPQCPPDAAPIFTPPATHPGSISHLHPSHGMPSSSTTRLDEAMAADDSLRFRIIFTSFVLFPVFYGLLNVLFLL